MAESLSKSFRQEVIPDHVAEMIVGRKKDGSFLGNSFADDPVGYETALFSHIRKMNRRTGDSNLHRIIRRGVTYETESERGLLFNAYMASMEEQFEFLQVHWANNPHRPQPYQGADALIGEDRKSQSERHTPAWVRRKRGSQPHLEFERFIRTRGGLYGFMPSMPTLRSLASGI